MNNKHKDFPKHRWYDWVFLATVGLFVGAIAFIVLDSVFLHKFRIICRPYVYIVRKDHTARSKIHPVNTVIAVEKRDRCF